MSSVVRIGFGFYLAIAATGTAGVMRLIRFVRSVSQSSRWRVSQKRPGFELAPRTTTASDGPPCGSLSSFVEVLLLTGEGGNGGSDQGEDQK